MAGFKTGDRVTIVYSESTRAAVKDAPKVKEKDKDLFTIPLIYPYMDGLVGTVANYYSKEEVSVELDLAALTPVIKDLHTRSTLRIRAKFTDQASEEAKKKLTEDELNFTPHFVVLVSESDLQKA